MTMQRREFISVLGGATAWPRAGRAQQPAMPVIGYLYSAMPFHDQETAFRKGLGEHGFVEGRNVAIEYRFARNDPALLPELAADLVRRRVKVIAAVGGIAPAVSAKAATRNIPIVFRIGGDPVEDGLVASFNRPGGNLTGITSMNSDLESKRLGLLCELVPGAARIGYLGETNPARIRLVQSTAAALQRQVEFFSTNTSRGIDDAFASLAQKRIDAVLVATNPTLYGLRAHLANAAARAGIPAMYGERAHVEAGGLMSYGTENLDTYRLVGVQVGRILKGEKPADLPVMRPTKFEFIVNLQTARLLRIDIPPTLLALTDAVIE
jgi:putative ABC transport system substrate-binding protein